MSKLLHRPGICISDLWVVCFGDKTFLHLFLLFTGLTIAELQILWTNFFLRCDVQFLMLVRTVIFPRLIRQGFETHAQCKRSCYFNWTRRSEQVWTQCDQTRVLFYTPAVLQLLRDFVYRLIGSENVHGVHLYVLICSGSMYLVWLLFFIREPLDNHCCYL